MRRLCRRSEVAPRRSGGAVGDLFTRDRVTWPLLVISPPEPRARGRPVLRAAAAGATGPGSGMAPTAAALAAGPHASASERVFNVTRPPHPRADHGRTPRGRPSRFRQMHQHSAGHTHCAHGSRGHSAHVRPPLNQPDRLVVVLALLADPVSQSEQLMVSELPSTTGGQRVRRSMDVTSRPAQPCRTSVPSVVRALH